MILYRRENIQSLKRSTFSILKTVLLLFTVFAAARAAAGDLDLTFGGGGITPSAGTGEFVTGNAVIQPDGKILVGGYRPGNQQSVFVLARFLPNGLPDSTFGTNGLAVTPSGYGVFSVQLSKIALLPNGEIVAVGSARSPYLTSPVSRSNFFLIKYKADGSPDTNFGNNGSFTSSEGGFSTGATAVAVADDGKFVVAGYTGGSLKGPSVPVKILLYRFDAAGDLDSTFGNNGMVQTQLTTGDVSATSISIQPDKKIVVGSQYANSGVSLTRYNIDGTLDASFGTNGFVVVNDYNAGNISGILIQPDGKISAVGSAGSGSAGKFFALRVNTNGSRDAAFGSNGAVVTDITADSDAASGGVLQPDGKIIAVGYSYVNGNFATSDAAMVRYNRDGSLDPSFGDGGIVRTPAGFALGGAALQPDGKIVVATKNLRAIRFLGDASVGLPRPTAFDFDGDGWADFSVTRDTSGHFNWYAIENPSLDLLLNTEWGETTDKTVPADYDGDRKTDVAVFRPRDGIWYMIKSSDNVISATQFGRNGDIPVAADFDGDGAADKAVYRSGIWYILDSSNGGFRAMQFGVADDKPLAGDYDGDGKNDLAVYRAGTWYLQQSSAGFFAAQFGLADDVPVPADYDGDGKTDLAVYRRSNGTWYLQTSTQGFKAAPFGIADDILVPADYDGDGKTDIAVFRSGVWFIRSPNGELRSVFFGASTDSPIAAAR